LLKSNINHSILLAPRVCGIRGNNRHKRGQFPYRKQSHFIDRQPDCFDLNGIIVGDASFEQRCKKMLKDGALELMKNESSEDGNAATAGSL
jgi:hypothetical protein